MRYYRACPERSRGNDQRVLLETDYDSGTQSETDMRYFVYGNYIDEVLVMADIDGGAVNTITDGDYYYGHDHLYSVAALFDDTGAVVER